MRTVLKATCGKHSKAISVSQITHFVAEDKYVIAYYPDGVLVLNETLKALETEFADEFIRRPPESPSPTLADQHVQNPT
ncbi:TPA: LytTR family transcriptional regulator DNA-binding domain-containing protein [Pseudomonas aeruginosa]